MKGGGVTSQASAEIIIRPGVVPVLILEPLGPVYSKVIQRLKGMPTVQAIVCVSPEHAVSLVERAGPCVIVCYAGTQEQLVKHITMLKLLKGKLSSGQIRVILTTLFKQKALEEKLKAFGFSEIIPEPVEERLLAARIDRSARTLPVSLEVKKPQEKTAVESVASSSHEGHHSHEIRMVSPLTLESDFWLFQNEGTRAVMDQWTIRLKGPGPGIGSWVSIQGETKGIEQWKWVPKSSASQEFMKGGGVWIFKGQAPRFENSCWTFVSKNPSLTYYVGEKALGSKVSMDPSGDLLVTYDSLNAVHLRAVIETSLESPLTENPPESLITHALSDVKPSPLSQKARAAMEEKLGSLSPQAEQALAQADCLVAALSDSGPSNKSSVQKIDGPDAIRAIKASEPTLKPVAFAFLMSELAAAKSRTPRQMADRFCSYLEAACNGIHAELWFFRDEEWSHAGSNQGISKKLTQGLQGVREGLVQIDQQSFAGVIRSEQDLLLGALVVSGAQVSGIAPDYLISVGKMTTGLLQTLVFLPKPL